MGEYVGFARPWVLLLLLAVPLLALLAWAGLARRQRAIRAFAGGGARLVSRSLAAQVAKSAMVLVALAALTIALAGPQLGQVEREVTREGVDIVFAIDVSQSMAVQDVTPDRLQAASRFVEQATQGLAGSRAGIVLFAGDGIVRYPTTFDLRVLPAVLEQSGRGFKPRSGSSLTAGIRAAIDAFPRDVLDSTRPKAIVVLSDGEDASLVTAPYEALLARNTRVYTVGIGTAQGGPIPTYDLQGTPTGNLRSGTGDAITSRLDEANLRRIADQGSGRYWAFTGAGPAAGELAGELRAQYVVDTERELTVRPDDRFQWFLAVAALVLLAEWFISERRAMPRPRPIQ